VATDVALDQSLAGELVEAALFPVPDAGDVEDTQVAGLTGLL
jgi:hypothetical protein